MAALAGRGAGSARLTEKGAECAMEGGIAMRASG